MIVHCPFLFKVINALVRAFWSNSMHGWVFLPYQTNVHVNIKFSLISPTPRITHES